MKTITVIYWSSTGNTESMAKAIVEGVKSKSNEDVQLKLMHVSKATIEDVVQSDIVALGCSAMGVESLDSSEMEPYVNSIRSAVKDKALVLFGSYDWGDGEWIEDWQDDMVSAGAKIIAENLIITNTPDDQGLDRCKALGRKLSTQALG